MTTPKAKLAGLALIVALCAGFTLGLTAAARAGFDEGVAAFNRGDYGTALREWRPLAEQGLAEAQYNLGFIYDDGLGVTQDYARGVTQDYVQAHMWYNLAANFVKLRRDKAEVERRRAKKLAKNRRAKKLEKKRRAAKKRRAKELERKRRAAEAEKRRAKELEIFQDRARDGLFQRSCLNFAEFRHLISDV